jgi:prepilin-type N-terminal cleavage/methylation domain-containing protein
MRNERYRQTLELAEHGFTLIEVLISILITLIVMGAVFGLLTRGQRSFRREPEVADLQQSARTILDMVAKDILQAGGGLPPEFPAFSRINGAGNGNPSDVLEIIGTFQSAGNVYLEAEDVGGIAGNNVVMLAATTNLSEGDPGIPNDGDIVVLYNNVINNEPNGRVPQWALARVTAVDETGPQAQVTLNYAEFLPAYSNHLGGPGNPPNPPDFVPVDNVVEPKIARVSIVRYSTQLDDPARYNGPPPLVLMRDVDFANAPQAVGYLEDFEIQYMIGIAAPVLQDNPPDPVVDLPAQQLTAENMLSSVRITIVARSVSSGMEGASEGAGAGRDDDFIRKTFSTNVNPRNLSAGLEMRTLAAIAP